MQVVTCTSPTEFLERSARYRALDPVRTNMVGSIATSVAAGFQRYDACWWWIVLNENRVVGAACRTAPYWLQLGPMMSDASALLAREVARVDVELPGVVGSENVTKSFVDGFRNSSATAGSRRAVQSQHNLIYEATDLMVPDVEGHLEHVTTSQFDLASKWHVDFSTFIDGAPYTPSALDLAALEAKIENSMMYFWIVDDEPVSMVGHASAVMIRDATVTRIGPVFTPEEHRRHGYAAAATASLSKKLSQNGSRVMLLADATYSTSNHVYRSIGFRVLDSSVRYEFS